MRIRGRTIGKKTNDRGNQGIKHGESKWEVGQLLAGPCTREATKNTHIDNKRTYQEQVWPLGPDSPSGSG